MPKDTETPNQHVVNSALVTKLFGLAGGGECVLPNGKEVTISSHGWQETNDPYMNEVGIQKFSFVSFQLTGWDSRTVFSFIFDQDGLIRLWRQDGVDGKEALEKLGYSGLDDFLAGLEGVKLSERTLAILRQSAGVDDVAGAIGDVRENLDV
ncbi:MAG: hypothetical protein WC897_03710 [Candidatus Gracilibacteria bacterium]